jgi:hypothetical protein
VTIPHPGFPRPGFPQTAPPKAPGATASLVLGIVSVAGLFVLVVPVFLAPLAWYHGVAAGRRAEREPDRWSGRGEARAGAVLGMIGCGLALVVLAVLLLAGLGVLLASVQGSGYRS